MSGFFFGRSLRSGYPLYPRQKKAWDTAAIPNANPAHIQYFTKPRIQMQ
jgi:hypothetical protein